MDERLHDIIEMVRNGYEPTDAEARLLAAVTELPVTATFVIRASYGSDALDQPAR